ncbi:MAG: diguanylate cyclase [Chloroflexi bacterium]|nr:diguanylate cyclase [Chloroflexota bacterium]
MEDNNKIKEQLISEIEKLHHIIDEYEKSKPDLKEIEEALKDSKEKYETLINSAPFGVITLNKKGIIASCNSNASKLLGQSKEEIIGKHFTKQKFLSEEIIPRYLKIFSHDLSNKEGMPFEVTGLDKNGKAFFGEVCCGIIKKDNVVKSIQISITDITKRKEIEEKLKYLRFHDNLTGLYNRAYFEEEMKRLDSDRQLPLSFIVGDVNGLKLINDAFGNEEGDRVLKSIAAAIRECCRKEDIIARWGEDEFSVLLPRTSMEYARDMVNRIKEICQNTGKSKTKFNFSIGTSTKQDPDQNFQSIVKEAKDEMYKSKLFVSKSVPDSVISSVVDSLMETSFETREHGKRIRKMVLKLGHALSLSKSKLDELSILADLHDLGKIAIPDDIVKKKNKLNEKDWQVLKSYPEIGYNIASSSSKISHIAEYILTHHERWDGAGYPQGLKGEDIPLASRITAIADAYDVMRSGRFYKGTLSKKDTIEELRKSSGKQFDPKLVGEFIKILEEE